MSKFFGVGGNPAFTEERISKSVVDHGETMTIGGAIQKTVILFVLMLIPAIFMFNRVVSAEAVQPFSPLLIGGLVIALIAVLVGTFNPKTSPVTAPIYAVAEGIVIGGISASYGLVFEGIVFQAIALTMGVLLVMIGLYSGRVIRATNKFVKIVVTLTIAVCMVYILTWVLGMFGINIPYIHGNGPIGIIFSVGVVVLAALNFILDFDMIEKGQEYGAPKYMEWFGAMGIMITLIWLYINILRLLSKLQRD